MAKNHILILSNNPDRASFRQRIGIHLQQLERNGIFCIIIKFPKNSISRWKVFRQARNYDAILLHKKILNFWDAYFLRRQNLKIFYDFDDAVMYSAKKPQQNHTSHFKLFRRTAKLADVIIAGNSYLAEQASRFNDCVQILPTGLNIGEYDGCPAEKTDDKIRLVWIGSKSTLKYLAEIKPALEQIGSRYPNVILRIICDEFFELSNMPVDKCLWSLKTQAAHLISSDIGLSPLPDNRFTRGKCGFKALQYAAAGLPCVASPVGVNADYVIDGITGFHASDNKQWIEKISRLIDNSSNRKQMGKEAKAFVAKFDTCVIGIDLLRLIKKHIAPIETEEKYLFEPVKGQPRVSICIPTYNRKHYLRETLNSIFAQTYKNYEIIIVDDGSTDGTGDMIKQMDFPIIYHWQPNNGDAAARNKLIELAKGTYISFIDSDDLLMPEAIERMVSAIEKDPEDAIVYGSYLRIDNHGNTFGRCKRKLYSGFITKYLFQTIMVHSCGSLIPKKIINESGNFDTSLKVCSDYDFWLRLSAKYKFIALPQPTFKRRRHAENLSKASSENCITELQVLERFYYQKGGNKLVPASIALDVFSKETRRIGRCALKEGSYNQAFKFFYQSFKQHPNFKSLAYLTAAKIAKILAADSS